MTSHIHTTLYILLIAAQVCSLLLTLAPCRNHACALLCGIITK
ncbi:hypothetical protein HMPREF3232_01087 [Fannyhessea vaginae]|nr:hypothetical protein HMPREF3232_01087 [Fannyhessea vaginae]